MTSEYAYQVFSTPSDTRQVENGEFVDYVDDYKDEPIEFIYKDDIPTEDIADVIPIDKKELIERLKQPDFDIQQYLRTILKV